MKRLPALALLVALLLPSTFLSGCLGCGAAASSDAEALRARIPAHAARVLDGAFTFAESDDAFVAAPQPDGEPAPTRGGLVVRLPKEGSAAVRFELASGFSIGARELGLAGRGAVTGHTVTYARPGGTSYWVATASEYEEWLWFDAGSTTGERPVASWEVEGGALREQDAAIEILDGAGVPRVRVAAPEAHTPSGRRLEPRLSVRGSTIELWADSAGEAVLVDPSWTSTTNLNASRGYHTATLLPNGSVFVAGGAHITSACFNVGGAVTLGTTETYDPATAFWANTAKMNAREQHTATLLQNGLVLVAGGFTRGGNCSTTAIASAQLYDPAANTWSAAPSLAAVRLAHTATLLVNGKVVVAGGAGSAGPLNSVEIYDPGTNMWSAGAPMSTVREYHMAVRLNDGRVLVAAGHNGVSALASAEVYNPATNLWSPTGSMILARYYPVGVLLADGRYLASGGWVDMNGTPVWTNEAEIYDPAASAWSVIPSMANARSEHQAILLADGRALVAGGKTGAGGVSASEIYDPSTNAWSAAGNVLAYAGQTLTLLPSGKALVTGGYFSQSTSNMAALFDPGGALGASCALGSSCVSGYCADGVCCNTACGAGACDACSIAAGAPSNGVCAQLTGNACNDGNFCTQTDTCQGGVCTGSNPVVCSAPDQCHNAGACIPVSGVCGGASSKANGTACSDGNACTQGDTCQSGVCTGGAPVVCSAPDQCHTAGTCNAATGICGGAPNKADGAACNDGNACTQTDTCQGGVCTGANPVACIPQDQCHANGACNPATGACSNPAQPNGTACSDGNACTLADTCQAGVCASGTPVVCNAAGQCASGGSCNPATGVCSGAPKPDGTPCNDGSACTQNDTCKGGACISGSPVVCAAQDQCHAAGACSPATGACSNPAKADGISCSDGDACTQIDSCQSGVCLGNSPVVCAPTDQCHDAGACIPQTGQCSNPAKPDQTLCNDGDACTQHDACLAGVCTGTQPVMCPPLADTCALPGLCNPLNGVCSYPSKPVGTACDDGNACTKNDKCSFGACQPGDAVVCPVADECHDAGTCDPASGICSGAAKVDGTPCKGGVCMAGKCGGGTGTGGTGGGSTTASSTSTATSTSSSSSAGSTSSSSGDSGVGGGGVGGSGSGAANGTKGGCGCGVSGSPVAGGAWCGLLLLLGSRRRSRTRPLRS